ncbi:MAG TPA: FAD-binding oxidoreductase [Candidatus Thermoplasmatota archaeon]|jgi:FAD/FMN-containing dehydrogenase|nr:FAD-binding oxidoreductase [Candidatus Thermoplasmatota archaeon]
MDPRPGRRPRERATIGNPAGTAADDALPAAAVDAFRASLRGDLLRPGDARYGEARTVFNAMIDRRPALIARCAGVADVTASVRFAREQGVAVAVKAGGHSVAGKSVCDGGLVIDLSGMKGMQVDPARRIARAQAGLRLGEFDAATQAFALATPLGIVSDTGIAGLTLGGGIGWLNGRHGLACDNVRSVDIVTADGQLRTASASEHEDLFWAVRGGGGNFGTVTSFEYQLHPVREVLGGMVLHPMRRAAETLRFYDGFARAAPDDLTTAAALLTSPDGAPVVAVLACHCGPPADASQALKPLRDFGPPAADLFAPRSYADMQRLLDASWPPGRLHYWKSSFLRTLSDDAIATMVAHAAAAPSPLSAVVLQQMHGAASRVGPRATAFAHRAEQWDFGIYAMWTDPSATDKNVAWARAFWDAMQPFLERSVYVNNLGDEGDARVRSAYGPNYERLAAVKRRYDPSNLFSRNQNILPGGP